MSLHKRSNWPNRSIVNLMIQTHQVPNNAR